jgi:hypothetical protein
MKKIQTQITVGVRTAYLVLMIAIAIGLYQISSYSLLYISVAMLALALSLFAGIHYENGEPWARITLLAMLYVSVPLFMKDILDFLYIIDTATFIVWGYIGVVVECLCLACTVYAVIMIHREKRLENPYEIRTDFQAEYQGAGVIDQPVETQPEQPADEDMNQPPPPLF